MQLPFGRTRALEAQVDAFLDVVAKGVLGMQAGVRAYLRGDLEEMQGHIERVAALESEADHISRSVETALYTYSLLPESRGDVLQVLEHTDNLVDIAKGVLESFEVERPDVPEELRPGFLAVLEASGQAADQVVMAARAYFRDPNRVKDFVNKVDFYESEADRAARRLKTRIFRSPDLDLGRKQHLRYFAEQIETLSDFAEDVGALLTIATIKRSV